jgi:N-acyl homoserine lactone hydrolase
LSLRRRVLKVFLAGLLLAAGALAWTFLPLRLPEPAPYAGELPPAAPPPGMSLSALPTGAMLSRAMFAFRGGGFGDAREFSMTALLVRHPRGDLLIDTGFGRAVDAHVAATPRLAQALTRYTKGVPAAAQLRAHGVDPASLAGVVLTHGHWDHVSGLDGLADAPVWITPEEHAFVREGGERSALLRSFTGLRWREVRFDGGEYLGFPRSLDVWGDGSVVLVPAPGHTPGSIIVFVALPSGARYVLLGDLVWQLEGITRPAERPWFARRMLGEDEAQLRAGIARIAALQRRFPQWRLLPAHDARVFDTIPVFPDAAR